MAKQKEPYMAMQRKAVKKRALPQGATFWYYRGHRDVPPVPVQVFKETESSVWIASSVNSSRTVSVSRQGYYSTKKAAFDQYIKDCTERVARYKSEMDKAAKMLPKAKAALKNARLEARRKEGQPKKAVAAKKPRQQVGGRVRVRRKPDYRF